jgi:type III secretion protein U
MTAEIKLKNQLQKGDVPKSKEMTSVILLGTWLALGLLLSASVTNQLIALFEISFSHSSSPKQYLLEAGMLAFKSFTIITIMLFVPVMLIGIVAEYLQIGSVFSFEKLKFKFDKLNPVDGFKKMVSMDNLIEIIKSIFKTLLLIWISWLIIKSALPDMFLLANATIDSIKKLFWETGIRLVVWVLLVFTFIAILDLVYQRHSFTKKNRMSMRDIRQESKESEGDPHIKSKRRQLAQEWATSNAQISVRSASALVVNPTHLAVALEYDPEKAPVPIVSAKGEDLIALAMRQAAEEAGVPILRNISLARELHANVELDSVIPSDMFELVAQVIVWAKQVQAAQKTGKVDVPTGPGAETDDPGTGRK